MTMYHSSTRVSTPFGQHAESASLASEQRRHDPRIEGRAASGDALGGLEELGDVQDPVLEQIAEAALTAVAPS
jgi:hypothetical protein